MKENQSINLENRGDSVVAFKSGFWYVVSTFLTKGLAFLTMPFFTRIMTKADYGEFTNFASWVSLLLIITSFEMYNTINRAYYDYKENFDDYVSSISFLSIAFSFLFFVIVITMKDRMLNWISIPERFIPLMFFAVLLQNSKQVYLAREKTLYRYKSVAWLSVLSAGIPTLISLAIIPFVSGENQLDARMYGFWIPCGLVGLWCLINMLVKSRRCSFVHIRYALVLALPLFIHYFTTYLLTATNPIIAKTVIGAEASAIVSVASSILNLLIMFFQAITGALTTWIMDNLEMKQNTKIRKVCNVIACGLGAISIGLILITPELVLLLGGKEYPESASLIPPLSLAVCIQSVTTILTIIFTYDKKVLKISIATGIVAIGSLIAKIVLLPAKGLTVLAWMNIVAFSIIFVIAVILLKKTNYADCINVKVFCCVFATVALFYLCSKILYRNLLLRLICLFVLVIGIAVVLVKTKRIWLSFFRNRSKKKVRQGEA